MTAPELDIIQKLTDLRFDKASSKEESDAVAALQRLLHELGFDRELQWEKYGADGLYGPATTAAVAEFAKRNGFGKKPEATGERVTKRLARKILERHRSLDDLRLLASDAEGGSVESWYRKGGSAKRVTALQTVLNELGVVKVPLEVDGDYGPKTKKAVAAFASRDLVTDEAALPRHLAQRLVSERARSLGGDWRDPERAPIAPRGTRPVSMNLDRRERILTFDNGVSGCLLNVKHAGQTSENWCWAACAQMLVGYMRSLGEVACPTCGRTGADEDLDQGRQMNRRLGDPEVDCCLLARADELDKSSLRYQELPDLYEKCDRGGWPYFYEFEPLVQSTKWAARRHVLEESGLRLDDDGPLVRLSYRLTDQQLRHLTYNSGPEFKKRLDDAEGCALSWEMLTSLLDDRRPVAFSYRFPVPASGHMRVAAGYVVTPGDKKWVAVCDPLPPVTGEILLIPYEYYKNGPYNGHWRDYWIGRPREDGTPQGLPLDGLRVGRELVATPIEYPEDDPWGRGTDDGDYELSETDKEEAREEAAQGLEALQALAEEAPAFAANLGMGNFAAIFARALAREGRGETVDPDSPESGLFEKLLPGEKLELNEELIPVYELDKKRLKAWDGKDWKPLFGKPREIIWEIVRPKQGVFSFFGAATVRRSKAGWRLTSLGRSFLMVSITVNQVFSSFRSGKPDESLPWATYRGLVDFLWPLGLLDFLIRGFSDTEVRDTAYNLGYDDEVVKGYLRETPRRPVDIEKLRVVATVRDMSAQEVRKAAKSSKLPSAEVNEYLRRRDASRLDDERNLPSLSFEQLERLAATRGSKAFEISRPEFILEVPQLYQLFVAYKDQEHLTPIYPASFHRPGRRVPAGELEEVLLDLKRLATGREVEP